MELLGGNVRLDVLIVGVGDHLGNSSNQQRQRHVTIPVRI